MYINSIELADELDSDGEMEIEVPTYEWINKAQAQLLVEHLQKVFALPIPTTLVVETVYSQEHVGDRK